MQAMGAALLTARPHPPTHVPVVRRRSALHGCSALLRGCRRQRRGGQLPALQPADALMQSEVDCIGLLRSASNLLPGRLSFKGAILGLSADSGQLCGESGTSRPACSVCEGAQAPRLRLAACRPGSHATPLWGGAQRGALRYPGVRVRHAEQHHELCVMHSLIAAELRAAWWGPGSACCCARSRAAWHWGSTSRPLAAPGL